MFGIRARIYRRLGFSCCEFGSIVRGNVELDSGVLVGKGARLHAETGSIKIGRNTKIMPGVIIATYGGKIEIGSDTSINPYSVLYGHGDLSIGNNVLIAAHCLIVPANHIFADLEQPINSQGLTKNGIIIEDNVWLGGHSSILDTSYLASGAIVGAGSVVRGRIPSNEIWAGVPARKIKDR